MRNIKVLLTLILSLGICNTTFAQIEVMSYNIKYATENDGENSWPKRKDHLTSQIKYYEPDIMGVQEALVEQLQHLRRELDEYEYIGVGRDQGNDEGEFSAIFYDTTQFIMLEEDTFWLSETPEKPSKGWDAALPRICTYGLFEKKDSGERFYVFNTHFDHVGQEARAESTKLIVEKIKNINKNDFPVILMGDLNLEPNTQPIEFLSKEFNDSKVIAEKVAFGPDGTYNGYHFDEPVTRRIDYIFTDDHFRVVKYAVLSDSKDLKYPSDHLPVIVELEFE